ncbi:hypothetical protein CROQUDRAFT_719198 [Cronartium quercuum f. sp. fusiforme G11]|uniref:FAD-binding domain-containing protein n=1 Tax=Cronartium quercuum f. sp. fusiforme G11 TaxID=708437 RepID=A0A9P6THC3_9BASI|nr:hypothetical protein CROQUDRAFT_719198 [Cronartium quercuum f. sp. fusiforme G11]
MVESAPSKDEHATGAHPEPRTQNMVKLINIWLRHAQVAFETRNIEGLVELIDDQGYWRDILTLDLDFNALKKYEIKPYFECLSLELPRFQNLTLDRPESVRLIKIYPGVEVIQGLISFETESYKGSGLVQLRIPKGSDLVTNGKEDLKAMLFFTQIWEVKGHEERIKSLRPLGTTHTYEKGSRNWLEMRTDEIESYGISAQPTVLIIGAGHNGLMLAARLRVLGVSCLLLDKCERVGDCWRKRYRSLCLHDPISASHFPYLPYPDSWPTYIPKDKVASWFEHYAEAMELSIWLQSTIKPGATYDASTGSWSVEVNRPTGSRKLRPRYLVMATGLSGEAQWPTKLPIESFTGTLIHSSQFKNAAGWEGKQAVVIGACNSAHDLAAELWANNAASVTIVQRSSTYVMSSQHGIEVLLKGTYVDGPSTADADLEFTSLPLNVVENIHSRSTVEIAKRDRPLLDSLTNVGFKLDPYPGGLLMKFFRRGGGYYIDVGCSKLIADRQIKLKQGVEVTELTPNGVRFTDGEEIEADLVVCATGYSPLRDSIRTVVGSQVADTLGPIWGTDTQGEIPGVWRLCGHPAFWNMCGNFALSRCYSRHVATQILLQELGIYDKNFPGRLNKIKID